MRTRYDCPSESEISVTLRRLGKNRRLVLRLEWLTLWPTRGFLPVNSHCQDIVRSSHTVRRRTAPLAQAIDRFMMTAGRIETGPRTVKLRAIGGPAVPVNANFARRFAGGGSHIRLIRLRPMKRRPRGRLYSVGIGLAAVASVWRDPLPGIMQRLPAPGGGLPSAH